jgi:MFS family permease
MEIIANKPSLSIKQSTGSESKTYLWTLFCVCFFSTLFGGIVSTLMSVYLPVAVKDLLGNKGPEDLSFASAYINAAFVLGWAIGGFVWGIISDRIGRKKAVIYSVAFYGMFTLLTGYMPSWWSVVLCRALSGFGVGGVLVATTTIMIEEWPSQSKAIFMGILSIAIPVGIFSAGVITHAVGNWRAGFGIGVIPLGISLLSILLLKESQSWEKACHRIRSHGSKTQSIFPASSRRELLAGSLIFGTMLIGLWAIFSWIPTWIQSLIATSDGNQERSTSMMIFGMGGLTGGFLSGWLLKAMDARKSLILCFAACSFSALVLFKTNNHFSAVIYGEIVILALFFGASQGVLSVFIPELFPTAIRATATGFCFNIGRLFTAIAVLFVGVLETWLGGYGNALFIFSLVFIVGLLVTLQFKKTGSSMSSSTRVD